MSFLQIGILVLFLDFGTGDFISKNNLKYKTRNDPCYNPDRSPVRCVPSFVNAAYGKPVMASSTCGTKKQQRYCSTNFDQESAFREECRVCDATIPSLSHPASLLTDLSNPVNQTCWVSEPSVEYPSNVTVTLSLGKRYELTYVSLQFCKQRPDSMVIYKSNDFGKSWTPFQYYSSQCKRMYDKSPNAVISKHNEQEALCTDAHSKAILKEDRIAFSTLEGRPSSFTFEQSPVLQDWVTATDIRIVFNRLSLDQNNIYGIGER